MTKELFLIRHAKAEEPSNSSMVRDIDRELTSKGIMEAAKLGNFLKSYISKPEKIYCSPSVRTFETSKLIGEQLKLNIETDVNESESLYGGGARGYLELLNELPESITNVAIVGHNPDISFFAEYLTRDDTQGNMGTATSIHLVFETTWAQITSKSGKVSKIINLNVSAEDE